MEQDHGTPLYHLVDFEAYAIKRIEIPTRNAHGVALEFMVHIPKLD